MNFLLQIDPKTGGHTKYDTFEEAYQAISNQQAIQLSTAKTYLSNALGRRLIHLPHIWVQVPDDIGHMIPQIVERAILRQFFIEYDWGNLPTERLTEIKTQLTGLTNVADRPCKEAA